MGKRACTSKKKNQNGNYNAIASSVHVHIFVLCQSLYMNTCMESKFSVSCQLVLNFAVSYYVHAVHTLFPVYEPVVIILGSCM